MDAKKTECMSQGRTELLRALPGKTLLEKSLSLGFANQGSLSRWKKRTTKRHTEILLLKCFMALDEEQQREFIKNGISSAAREGGEG